MLFHAVALRVVLHRRQDARRCLIAVRSFTKTSKALNTPRIIWPEGVLGIIPGLVVIWGKRDAQKSYCPTAVLAKCAVTPFTRPARVLETAQ